MRELSLEVSVEEILEVFGICHILQDGSHGTQMVGGDVFLGKDRDPIILDDICHGQFQIPSLEAGLLTCIEESGGRFHGLDHDPRCQFDVLNLDLRFGRLGSFWSNLYFRCRFGGGDRSGNFGNLFLDLGSDFRLLDGGFGDDDRCRSDGGKGGS